MIDRLDLSLNLGTLRLVVGPDRDHGNDDHEDIRDRLDVPTGIPGSHLIPLGERVLLLAIERRDAPDSCLGQ